MTPARMPALFIGHGTPMNALEDNVYTRAWRNLAASIPTPKAILAVSAHWYTKSTAVTAQANPKTIHDFGGFPPELFAVEYPAPGDPPLARRVRDALAPVTVALDNGWGLDHGTWSVLVHMYPDAKVPVIQLSMDGTQNAEFHYSLGKKLRSLRDEGILLIGFGNVVHNLRTLQRVANAPSFEWAKQFNDRVREHILRGQYSELIRFESMGESAALSVPTPEHYLPLLYVLGAQHDDEKATVVCDGIDLGSISMLSVKIGI